MPSEQHSASSLFKALPVAGGSFLHRNLKFFWRKSELIKEIWKFEKNVDFQVLKTYNRTQQEENSWKPKTKSYQWR